jgi:hypothetical protein
MLRSLSSATVTAMAAELAQQVKLRLQPAPKPRIQHASAIMVLQGQLAPSARAQVILMNMVYRNVRPVHLGPTESRPKITEQTRAV